MRRPRFARFAWFARFSGFCRFSQFSAFYRFSGFVGSELRVSLGVRVVNLENPPTSSRSRRLTEINFRYLLRVGRRLEVRILFEAEHLRGHVRGELTPCG